MSRPPASDLRRFWRALSPHRRVQLSLLAGLMLAGAAAELITLGAVLPFLTLMTQPERAYDFPVIAQTAEALGWANPNDLLLPATLLFVTLAVTAGVIRITLAWATNKLVFGVGYDLSVEVYRRQLYQPYTYHVARNTSEIVAAVNKVQLVTQLVMLPAMQGVVAAIIAIAILTGLMLIDPVVAGAAGIGFGVIYLVISLTVRRRLQANAKVIAKKQSTRVQAVQEGLGGIRDVLLDGTQTAYVKRLAVEEGPLRAAQAVNNLIGALPKYLLESIGMVLIAGLAYFISQRAGGLATALPVLGALALGGQKLIPLMQQAYQGWTKLSGNRRMLTDVIDLVEQPIAAAALNAHNIPALPFHEQIALKQIEFRYRLDGPKVLDGVDLIIPRGSKVGFIGATGSGKSTLIDLVMGLLPPGEGSLEVDDVELDGAGRLAWQRRIAHVPQAIFLSDASIAENIALGSDPANIDTQRLRLAAERAQILDHIESLPKGFDTDVGERGVRLSGGQRQRIGIARALYKQADVLVLDEATSALDDATEKKVMAALNGLDDDLTVLLIAHRLSTLTDCDFIVKLEHGLIIDQGPPSRLLQQPGLTDLESCNRVVRIKSS